MSIVPASAGQTLSVGAADTAALGSAPDGSIEETFAALIERFGSQTPEASVRAGTSAPILLANADITADAAGETEIALGDMLSQLLEKLVALEETLQGETAPDTDALDEIGDLLAGVEQLMATAELPMPGGNAFEKLSALATQLGRLAEDGVGGMSNPFDALASVATKVADKAAQVAPDLATRLDKFASLLDRHSVHMQSVAAQDAEMPADTRRIIVLSEVQATPATDIKNLAQAAGQTVPSDTEADGKAETGSAPTDAKRTLAKPDAGTRPDAPSRQPPVPDNKATAPTAAQPSPDGAVGHLGDPDTVILPAGQQGASASQAIAGARAGQGAQSFAPQTAQINMQYVAAEITRQVQNGVNRFEIRLNPPELGRIDVRMEMDQSGNVIARLAVEKSETLDLMQRDQRALERALADAGLDSAKTELEFSLRQDGGGEDASDEPAWQSALPDQTDDPAASHTAPGARTDLYRSFVRPDGVNLWV